MFGCSFESRLRGLPALGIEKEKNVLEIGHRGFESRLIAILNMISNLDKEFLDIASILRCDLIEFRDRLIDEGFGFVKQFEINVIDDLGRS